MVIEDEYFPYFYMLLEQQKSLFDENKVDEMLPRELDKASVFNLSDLSKIRNYQKQRD